MEIKNVTINVQCTKTTSSTIYEVEYGLSNEQLVRVSANIYALVEKEKSIYLGNIHLDNDCLNSSFPSVKEITDISLFFKDFNAIVEEIKSEKEKILTTTLQ